MKSVVGPVVGILIVAGLVLIGLISSASKASRREIGTLIVDFHGASGVAVRIASGARVLLEEIGVRDTTRFGSALVLGSGLPREGQEVWVYHFKNRSRPGLPCFLSVAIAGLPAELERGLTIRTKREEDFAPSLPVADVGFTCPDFATSLATPTERRKDHGLLILEGELTITGRDGDTLVGTLIAPLVMSSYLSL